MGLIDRIFSAIFGGGRNAIVETAEVFRENAEQAGVREAEMRRAALAQFGQEFQPRRSWFDQLVDGLNRLPRPALAYGTLGLFIMAMRDPEWFASRMQGVALVPEPLWWLMGAIVSFYFGARHQAHTQSFQRSIAESLARLPDLPLPLDPPPRRERAQKRAYKQAAQGRPARLLTGPNAALEDWWASRAA